MKNTPSPALIKAVADEYLALTAPHTTFGSLTLATFMRRIAQGLIPYFDSCEVREIYPARKDGGTAYQYTGLTLAAFLAKLKGDKA